MGIFKPFHAMNKIQLHIKWQTSRNAIWIQFMRCQTLWFNKNLMACFIGKTMNFVFNRRAITRAPPLDRTGVKSLGHIREQDHLGVDPVRSDTQIVRHDP